MTKCPDCDAEIQPMASQPELKELRQKYLDMITDLGVDGYQLRSCWNCNSAHDHLKKSKVAIRCFCCNHIYLEGERLSEDKEQE